MVPKNSSEKKYWRENNKCIPLNIANGFIDAWKIPNREPYQVTKNVNNSMYLLTRKLKCTYGAPNPEQASLRCYKSWDSFVNQNTLNLLKCWEDMEKIQGRMK